MALGSSRCPTDDPTNGILWAVCATTAYSPALDVPCGVRRALYEIDCVRRTRKLHGGAIGQRRLWLRMDAPQALTVCLRKRVGSESLRRCYCQFQRRRIPEGRSRKCPPVSIG